MYALHVPVYQYEKKTWINVLQTLCQFIDFKKWLKQIFYTDTAFMIMVKNYLSYLLLRGIWLMIDKKGADFLKKWLFNP